MDGGCLSLSPSHQGVVLIVPPGMRDVRIADSVLRRLISDNDVVVFDGASGPPPREGLVRRFSALLILNEAAAIRDIGGGSVEKLAEFARRWFNVTVIARRSHLLGVEDHRDQIIMRALQPASQSWYIRHRNVFADRRHRLHPNLSYEPVFVPMSRPQMELCTVRCVGSSAVSSHRYHFCANVDPRLSPQSPEALAALTAAVAEPFTADEARGVGACVAFGGASSRASAAWIRATATTVLPLTHVALSAKLIAVCSRILRQHDTTAAAICFSDGGNEPAAVSVLAQVDSARVTVAVNDNDDDRKTTMAVEEEESAIATKMLESATAELSGRSGDGSRRVASGSAVLSASRNHKLGPCDAHVIACGNDRLAASVVSAVLCACRVSHMAAAFGHAFAAAVSRFASARASSTGGCLSHEIERKIRTDTALRAEERRATRAIKALFDDDIAKERYQPSACGGAGAGGFFWKTPTADEVESKITSTELSTKAKMPPVDATTAATTTLSPRQRRRRQRWCVGPVALIVVNGGCNAANDDDNACVDSNAAMRAGLRHLHLFSSDITHECAPMAMRIYDGNRLRVLHYAGVAGGFGETVAEAAAADRRRRPADRDAACVVACDGFDPDSTDDDYADVFESTEGNVRRDFVGKGTVETQCVKEDQIVIEHMEQLKHGVSKMTTPSGVVFKDSKRLERGAVSSVHRVSRDYRLFRCDELSRAIRSGSVSAQIEGILRDMPSSVCDVDDAAGKVAVNLPQYDAEVVQLQFDAFYTLARYREQVCDNALPMA